MRLVFSEEVPDFAPVRAFSSDAHVPGSIPVAKPISAQKSEIKHSAVTQSAEKNRVSMNRSRTRSIPSVLILLIAALAVLAFAHAQAQAVRLVQGVVRNSDDQPQANAVVYLQDQKNLEVRTFIVQPDGRYRFGQMSPDVDYQLWAQFKGHKSKTRSISSFDSKKEFDFDLKIDTSK